MSDDIVTRLLVEQRKRTVAAVLGHLEREVFAYLPPEVQRDTREKIRSAIDGFSDVMRDLIKVSRDDGVRNEVSLTVIQQIHDGQQRILREMAKRG